MIVFGAAMSAVEYQIFGKKDIFIGSLLMVIGIFLLSQCVNSGAGIVWKLGKCISGDMYYYHVMVIAALDIFLPLPMLVKPFVVVAICIVFFSLINSELWRLIKKR